MRRRRWKNYWIWPKFQRKIVGLAVGAALVIALVFGWIAYQFIHENYQVLVDLSPMEDVVKLQLYRELRWLQIGLFVSTLLYLGMVCVLSIVLSHRVAGPMFRFHRELLRASETGLMEEIAVRPGDDFQEVFAAFNAVSRKQAQVKTSSDGGPSTPQSRVA